MKAEKEFWSLSPASRIETILFYLVILFLPTQFGKHFWPDFSYILGQRIDYLSPTVYVTDTLLICLFLLMLVQKKIRIHPAFSLFTLFLGVNIFFSHFPANGWYFLIKFLEISFFAWYVSKKGINEIVGVILAISMVFEVFVGAFQTFLQHSIGGMFYFIGERSFSATTPGIANASIGGQLFLRPYATFSHPNIFAGYVLTISFVLLYVFQKKKNIITKTFLFITLLVGALGIIISLGRVAIVTEISGIILFFSKSYRNFLKILGITCIFIGGFIFLFSIFYPEIILRFLPSSFGQSITERVLLANTAVTMLKTNPLFGIGFGNFIPSLPFFLTDNSILQPVHNIFLLVVSELGLVGVTIFIFFLFMLFKNLLLKISCSEGYQKSALVFLTFSLLAILFTGLFDHYWLTIEQGQLVFGLVVGLCLHEVRSKRDTIRM